jgi:hypothetical protein
MARLFKRCKSFDSSRYFFFYCLIVYFLQNYDIEIRKKKKEDIKIVPEKEKRKKPKFME